MTYTISRNGEYLYVSRKPTEKERIRFISNGYNPPALVREPNASVYQYLRGELPPHYPMPAIPLACAILPDLVQIAEVWWSDDWLETQDTLPIQMAEFELVVEFEKD